MKIYIDSANIEQIKSAFDRRMIQGVTTNPSIYVKEPKRHIAELIKEISSVTANSLDIHIQVFGDTTFNDITRAMGSSARPLIQKVAVNDFEAFQTALGTKRKINATCVFTEAQAIMAAAMGAKYISFFWGRMWDNMPAENPDAKGKYVADPEETIRSTRAIFDRENIGTQIIAGSIRDAGSAVAAFNAGAHIVTTSLAVIESLFADKGSDASLKQFKSDWAKWTGA